MARVVSKAEFARLAGVSRTAISKACGKQLRRAMVGKRIDLDQKSAQIYLAGRDGGQTEADDAADNSDPEPPADRHIRADLNEDPDPYLDRTLREITDEFHGFKGFEDWLNARKKIADIREKDLKNEELEGLLIPRDGVRVHVFGAIDAAFERLVRDAPRNAAARAMAATRSGANAEEVERLIRDANSSVLKALKQKLIRALRDSRRSDGRTL